MNRIQFIIIGAMKSGTTSLWKYLGQHPQVYLGSKKEIEYFSSEENYPKGIDWYHSFFPGLNLKSNEGRIAGEASQTLTRFPRYSSEVPFRIFQYNPNMRLIYLLRNPLIRALSHFVHNNIFFDPAYDQDVLDKDFLIQEIDLQTQTTYFSTSDYKLQIERYLQFFPMDQLQIILSEDLATDCRNTLTTIYRFLQINQKMNFEIAEIKDNSTIGTIDNQWMLRPKALEIIKPFLCDGFILNRKKCLQLIERFEPIIEFSENMTNRKLEQWRDVDSVMGWQKEVYSQLKAMKFGMRMI